MLFSVKWGGRASGGADCGIVNPPVARHCALLLWAAEWWRCHFARWLRRCGLRGLFGSGLFHWRAHHRLLRGEWVDALLHLIALIFDAAALLEEFVQEFDNTYNQRYC